jgi:hypothetical protein
MNTAAVHIEKLEPQFLTRERRHASGAEGGSVGLSIYRDGSKFKVSWNINRGNGWRSKPWIATRATEAEATAFADEKWPTLVAWLEKLTPEENGGAVAAFSAQVASMSRW